MGIWLNVEESEVELLTGELSSIFGCGSQQLGLQSKQESEAQARIDFLGTQYQSREP